MSKRGKYKISERDIENLVRHAKEHKKLYEEIGLVGVNGQGEIQVGVDIFDQVPGEQRITIRPAYTYQVWLDKQYLGHEFTLLLTLNEAEEYGYITPAQRQKYQEIKDSEYVVV